jgi:hypothetical protein
MIFYIGRIFTFSWVIFFALFGSLEKLFEFNTIAIWLCFFSLCFDVDCCCSVYQRPQQPRWPPLSGTLCPWLALRLPPRVSPRTGPPPLWLGFWRPDPRPRWVGGSWPESQSGGGGGTGLGGEVGGCPIAAAFFLTGAGAGTTDSSFALLLSGSPSSPPLTRSAISFLAATLLALEVRWTPSPAQMLVPSTVVRSWGGDSPEPKKLSKFISLALPVLSPIAAASSRHFSAPANSAAS